MRPSSLLRATHYKPMIKFLGPRKNIEIPPHKVGPHPCAPKEVQESFQSFLSKLNSSSSSTSSSSSSSSSAGSASGARLSSLESTFKPTGKKVDYENYWEAPTYLWVQKEVTEREMEAVMSGGATDIRTGP
ncbi:hypothetical protein I305_06300 [Cryptococcus gattii E566]|uniref:Uncharacterized protein n=2 Tax=Cryptococcus gattii TaxID=37769 RepID=E6R1I7_CRYGW|nr:Hypothetical protein CGB_B9620W [Cryptococcus gattii WM276]ADV20651.1 Hypothetical protein CGB_B9620W [Cryptococcus gattii WM276]KIR76792.1 hypothetical protein I306_06224 [Cryptococcus gattii EJB2]KIY31193.1 hypothetical protein I305_06300 [Cryptococcus gattii E566]KJD99858.1 hypothetical protein I311_06536 [Cryptococcus gattii NT-10]